MKRAVKYMGIILALSVMFIFCYYMSYQMALRRLAGQEQKQEFHTLFDEQQEEAENMFAGLSGPLREQTNQTGTTDEQENKTQLETKENQAQETAKLSEVLIKPETKLVVETLEINSGDFSTKQMVPDEAIIGMNREEFSKYLDEELQNSLQSEENSGLYANELIRFSENKIVVRKLYDSERSDYQYYLAVKDGEVVVYLHDKKTVFEYTGILAMQLSEEARLSLLEGVYIQTTDELFTLLESYSS